MSDTQFYNYEEAVIQEDVFSFGAVNSHCYFGLASAQQFGPEAFIVDYPEDLVSRPHFHSVDQFQLFFGAPGATYRRTQIPRPFLHYTDAYTTYGPFQSRSCRMQFFTLRPRPSRVLAYMPEDRHLLPPTHRRRRAFQHALDDLLEIPVPRRGATLVEPVFERQADALFADFLSAGPESDVILPPASTGSAGCYFAVLEGWVLFGDHSYGPKSLAWTDSTAEPVTLMAGSAGCKALRLQFGADPLQGDHSQVALCQGA